jgi:hypothetical protein
LGEKAAVGREQPAGDAPINLWRKAEYLGNATTSAAFLAQETMRSA